MLQLAVLETETWHELWPRQPVRLFSKSLPVELPTAYMGVAIWNGKVEQSDVICCVALPGPTLGLAAVCCEPYTNGCEGAGPGAWP